MTATEEEFFDRVP